MLAEWLCSSLPGPAQQCVASATECVMPAQPVQAPLAVLLCSVLQSSRSAPGLICSAHLPACWLSKEIACLCCTTMCYRGGISSRHHVLQVARLSRQTRRLQGELQEWVPSSDVQLPGRSPAAKPSASARPAAGTEPTGTRYEAAHSCHQGGASEGGKAAPLSRVFTAKQQQLVVCNG